MSTEAKRQEVLRLLVEKMAEMFELDAASITITTHLFKDLDLDSIDAIDLAVQLQEFTGHKVQEATLRELRTVSDVVDLIVALQAQPAQ